MSNSNVFILLIFLSFMNYSLQYVNFYYTLSDQPKFKDDDNHELTCLGIPNPPNELNIVFEIASKETSADETFEDSQEIIGIEGGKLVNKNNKEISVPVLCDVINSNFVCKVSFIGGAKLEPGEYYFEAEEKLSGFPYPSAIRKIECKSTLVVTEKYNLKFPYYNGGSAEVYIENGKGNVKIEFEEDISEPPSILLGKKKYECQISESNSRLLLCPITREDYKEDEKGENPKLSLINACGQEEEIKSVNNINIDTNTDVHNETTVVGFPIFLITGVVAAVIVVVVVIVIVTIYKKKGQKDVEEIMKASYASEEEKKKQQEEEKLIV